MHEQCEGNTFVGTGVLRRATLCECGRARTVGGIVRTPEGSVDYREDFFGKPAFLTVSGQLNGEYYACALSNIYTFGPTFRCAMPPSAVQCMLHVAWGFSPCQAVASSM